MCVVAVAAALVAGACLRRPLLQTIVHGGEGPPTLVLLHGYGSSAEEWVPFTHTIKWPPPGRFVFPQAPDAFVPSLRSHRRSGLVAVGSAREYPTRPVSSRSVGHAPGGPEDRRRSCRGSAGGHHADLRCAGCPGRVFAGRHGRQRGCLSLRNAAGWTGAAVGNCSGRGIVAARLREPAWTTNLYRPRSTGPRPAICDCRPYASGPAVRRTRRHMASL